ncbi:hypothetical protein [Shimia sp. MIT1388]|uniref:hypothetical protein n=1 Tax=Shimia sp. MIT1388 TaxID=3096992 RepID=UPI00399A3A1F
MAEQRPTALQITASSEIAQALDTLVDRLPSPPLPASAQALLDAHGLIREQDVAALKHEALATTQTNRKRGRMPRHHRWGQLVCYRKADIAAQITAEGHGGTANEAHRQAVHDILNL